MEIKTLFQPEDPSCLLQWRNPGLGPVTHDFYTEKKYLFIYYIHVYVCIQK